MQITKKIIVPLIIMVILAGLAGIMSAREVTIQRTQHFREANTSGTRASDISPDATSVLPGLNNRSSRE